MKQRSAQHRHRVSRWRSITTRQAVLTFIVALLISIIGGGIELAQDARLTRAEVQQQTDQLMQVAGGTAAEAAFQLNTELAEQVISGLFVGEIVRRAVLRDDFGRIMASDEVTQDGNPGRLATWLFGDITDYRISLEHHMVGAGSAEPVGELEVDLSLYVIGQDFLARSTRAFALGMLKAFVIAALVVAGFHILITRPLLKIYAAILAADPQQPGEWPRPDLPSHQRDELGMLVKALHELLSAFQTGLDQRDELHQISTIDGLTGIANRRRFDEFLERHWLEGRRSSADLAAIFIDIDYFKAFNDNYGHAVGDDCLREVSRALSRALPRSTDLVARYGGEEFVCVLPHTDMEGALAVARNIQAAIRALAIIHEYSDINDYVTVSMGVASAVPGSAKGGQDDLLAAADRRLYQAKQTGRNTIVWADAEQV
ncbi:MAG: GGDEF domain-containing protein [Natronospirillum sp.]|uniref:GGDEF domain-containing protein n=1 Tax=Natronospirillum sp. TaxID=2812955 RepID=UPI0025DC7061|nr:diguanylate cyclase [Natronospirillum sp.]MCH8550759.1 GGDEF domain-containing protein [Natronospirillum sp.]